MSLLTELGGKLNRESTTIAPLTELENLFSFSSTKRCHAYGVHDAHFVWADLLRHSLGGQSTPASSFGNCVGSVGKMSERSIWDFEP